MITKTKTMEALPMQSLFMLHLMDGITPDILECLTIPVEELVQLYIKLYKMMFVHAEDDGV